MHSHKVSGGKKTADSKKPPALQRQILKCCVVFCARVEACGHICAHFLFLPLFSKESNREIAIRQFHKIISYYIMPDCLTVTIHSAIAKGNRPSACILRIATSGQRVHANEATLRSVRGTLQRSISVPAVFLPSANLHQHAEDIIGVGALDG